MTLYASFTFGYGIHSATPERVAAIERVTGPLKRREPYDAQDFREREEDADGKVIHYGHAAREAEDPDATDIKRIITHETYTCDLTKLVPVLGDVTIDVRGMGEVSPVLHLADKIEELGEQVLAAINRGGVPGAHPSEYVNPRVNVHVPGMELLAIDEVDVMYDICTDQLNDRLGEGWRIIAACPQPDQRRPDYVLGRRRPQLV